jgi:hypothetical protein
MKIIVEITEEVVDGEELWIYVCSNLRFPNERPEFTKLNYSEHSMAQLTACSGPVCTQLVTTVVSSATLNFPTDVTHYSSYGEASGTHYHFPQSCPACCCHNSNPLTACKIQTPLNLQLLFMNYIKQNWDHISMLQRQVTFGWIYLYLTVTYTQHTSHVHL